MSGTICGHNLQFLVDSGASHNFISAHLLESLGIVPHVGRKVSVKLADTSILTATHYLHVVVQFHGVTTMLRFTVLPATCPTILGMPFLRSMNPIIDW